jgi:hypothetical protein
MPCMVVDHPSKSSSRVGLKANHGTSESNRVHWSFRTIHVRTKSERCRQTEPSQLK